MKKYWIIALFAVLSSFSILFAQTPETAESQQIETYDDLADFRIITAKEGEVLEPPNPPWRLIGSIILFCENPKMTGREWSCMILSCESFTEELRSGNIYYFSEMDYGGGTTKSILFTKGVAGEWWINYRQFGETLLQGKRIYVKSIITW